MTTRPKPARTAPTRDRFGRVTPDPGGLTGAVADTRRPGIARRRIYQVEQVVDRPTIDRPMPYRTLSRRAAPPPLYATPPPRGMTGTYGDDAVRWLERRLPKWRAQDWQRQALRAVLAHDRKGQLIGRTALLMLPRQQGKTTLAQALIGWWMDEGPGGQVVGAATERTQARRVYSALYRLFASSPDLAARARITAHDGIYLGSSVYQTVSREAGSARGFAAGLVYFDELLTQTTTDTYDALRYAQAASVSPLFVATSTAGYADSIVLNDLEDRLIRIATGAEPPDPTFIGLKWGAPDYAPVDDDTLRASNPALASGLLKLADLRAEQATSTPGSFTRERLNQRTRLAEKVLPVGAWEACAVPTIPDDPERYYLAVDAAPQYQRATLVAGFEDGERLAVEVARDLRGTDAEPVSAAQLTAAVIEVVDRRRPLAIVYERAAAAAPVLEALSIDRPDLPFIALTGREVFDACQAVYLAIVTRRLAHVGDPLMTAQWGQVAKVDRDGGFRWARRRSAGYIDAVCALTFAAFAAARGEVPESGPQIWL